MKTPESPRAYPASLAESQPAEGREEKLVPRYVHAPALRDHGLGPRNLYWGVALLFVALAMLVVAIFLAGAQAMVSVATCLLTFTALFVLARLHVFRQRNGGFLALGMICLIGAGIPLAEKAYSSAKGFVGSRSASPSPVVTLHSDEAEAPLLTQSFALPKPQGDGKQVKVLRDSRVVIADKPFLIKAGDRFPLIGAKGDETTFAVRDLHVSLPSNVVEVVDPATLAKGVSGTPTALPGTAAAPKAAGAKSNSVEDAELAELTRSAQQEAMRRYPALAIKDSLENAMYVSTYKQLRDSGGDDFFSNPEWPIELAELLAKKEGWNRGGGPITTGPAPVLDPPADEAPAARPPTSPGNFPPTDALDAGSNLPRAGRPAR
ncbi:MAG: hypothetical protein ABJF10_19205 [Chthoniobacter sp.]|uniref:hypothetical protein n=1 Tax=Chthoniobacter sp. TaxID=2510640 RepID=UPI0032A7B4E4